MISIPSFNLQDYEKVREKYRFFLDIEDIELAAKLKDRIKAVGLEVEPRLTSRVSHVVLGQVRAAAAPCPPASVRRTRADAMLQRLSLGAPAVSLATYTGGHWRTLNVHQAYTILEKIENYVKSAIQKVHTQLFKKHFVKVEFLDTLCRPLFEEFDELPFFTYESTVRPHLNQNNKPEDTKENMTRKSRPRIKERDDKETKGGYCEICNVDYTDLAQHRKSLHHLAFVRNDNNYLSLDNLIASGADVATFLERNAPLNGERRSLRKCNGDLDTKPRRSVRSQSPESPVNGHSPRRPNGGLHNTRCSKRSNDSDDRQYYKVVGVSTKLRSSGGFANKRKDSPPPDCNGSAKPLVVKFRKVRRSELSVLSDEAEQFMFPKRASSASSTSSDEGLIGNRVKRSPKSPPQPPVSLERRRLARPLALKEESSEEDSWPESKRKKKRRQPVVRRTRPTRSVPLDEDVDEVDNNLCDVLNAELSLPPEEIQEVSPLREEVPEAERCMKWEDGRLKYTPAVEQLEFAFESVPCSEPWYDTFKRQDDDKEVVRNVQSYFALYPKSPKLPYEIGHLPPLKPNCCPLSDLVKREDKPGVSRYYGTRGKKKLKVRKRTAAALIALDSHPRKSPREHASTLAILGSAGLLARRKNADDAKSTASEDTASEMSNRLEPPVSDTLRESESLQSFLKEVYSDAAECEVPDDVLQGECALLAGRAPDVLALLSESDRCPIIADELRPINKPPRTPDRDEAEDEPSEDTVESNSSPDSPLRLDVKVSLRSEDKKPPERPDKSPPGPKKRRGLHQLGEWLQPVVRVARVDPAAARRLRSAGRARDQLR